MCCWLALVAVCAFGFGDLQIDTTTDSVLNTDSRAWEYYQESQSRFGGDQVVVVALPGPQAFSDDVLTKVKEFSGELEALEGVRRVDSLSTVPVIAAEPDGSLTLSPALELPVDSAEVRLRLREDRIAPRSLVSEDGTVFAINVLVEQNFADYKTIVDFARDLTDGTRVWISGVPVFRSTASERTRRELLVFVPLTLVVSGGLIAFAYGSVWMMAIALAIGSVGTCVVVAAMGFLGVPLSLITLLLPSIMLALGCAYAIHMLSAARYSERNLPDDLALVALPVALSSLTTAIGFSAIGTVAIDEVRYVGGFGALGALALGAATLTVAPALLALSPPPSLRKPSPLIGVRRNIIIRVATEGGGKAILAWIAVLVALGLGAKDIKVVSDPTQWFQRGSEVRDSYDSIGRRLSGISPVNVVIESSSGGSVVEPEPLMAVDGLTDYLESIAFVGKATSVRDPLRQIHGGFTGDHSQPLPLMPSLAEQYLLLLESVDQISDLIVDDRSAANVLLRVNDNGSEALLKIRLLADEWWSEFGPEGFEVTTTGIMYEFARAQDEIAYGQLRGLALAFCAIGVTIFLALRNVRLALLAMIPNVVPTAMVFGVMGWFGMALDAGTVVIGSLALGIAVDDTIHLANGFHERVLQGLSPTDALSGAVDQIMHPVVLTTVAIALGFGLFGFSGFTLTRNVGLLLAGITIVCLLADLLLLPSLLVIGSKRTAKY